MHYHCFTTFRRHHNSCPACNKDWPREATEKPLVPVGEAAAKEGQEDGKRRVRIKSVEASDQEDEDELRDENEPSQATQSQPKTQWSQRNKRGKAPADVNMNGDSEDDGGHEGDNPPKKSQAKRRSSRR